MHKGKIWNSSGFRAIEGSCTIVVVSAYFPLVCMMLWNWPVPHWLVEIPRLLLSFAMKSFDKSFVDDGGCIGHKKPICSETPHVVEPFLTLATMYEYRGEMEKLVQL